MRKYQRDTGWVPEVIDGYTNIEGVWDLPYLHIDHDRQFMQNVASHWLKQLERSTQKKIVGKRFVPTNGKKVKKPARPKKV